MTNTADQVTTVETKVKQEGFKTLAEVEESHIMNTLDACKGNKTQTAQRLGITVKTLYNKLTSYGAYTAKDQTVQAKQG